MRKKVKLIVLVALHSFRATKKIRYLWLFPKMWQW